MMYQDNPTRDRGPMAVLQHPVTNPIVGRASTAHNRLQTDHSGQPSDSSGLRTQATKLISESAMMTLIVDRDEGRNLG